MQEARDRAQFVLGAISLIVWFVVAFALAIAWFVDEYTPQPIFMAGGVAFLIAAVPWVAYRPLVERFSGGRPTPPNPPRPRQGGY